ncbi:MAG: serine/threonine protein kinase [Kofleriaceae bacterium]
MAEDKRTKFGTGPAPAQQPPRPAQSPSQATAILQPTGTEPPYQGQQQHHQQHQQHQQYQQYQQPYATPVPTQTPPPNASMSTSYVQGDDPLVGQTLAGRYLISKKLGEGGMGAVYLATHTSLEKQVALKVLHGEFARKPDLVERFMQEAKAASRIRHENVIDISDFGTTNEGMVFFAMELLRGHDLHEEVARARLNGQLLPWIRSKRIFLQICAALSAAHAHGIIHRDLKPENIYLIDFLGDTDFVKLLDFGIAKQTEVEDGGRKLTKTGMLFGTPEYMSPEQARGEQVDARVDVYAMGCILFQLVTGRVPFEADNFMGVLTLHLTEPPPMIPPEIFDLIGAPRELAGVIDRALAKDKTVRWSTIDDLANAVRRVCGDPIPTAGAIKAQPGNLANPSQSTVMNVQAPATTTQRQRTQWTGNVKVPTDAEIEPSGGRSKLPLILGVLVVLGAGGAAAFFATRNDPVQQGSNDVPSGSAPGSQVAGIGPGSVTVQVDAAAPPPELPPLPDRVKIKLGSNPTGADVKDLAKNRPLGKTPVTLDVKGSHEAISLSITKKGYADLIIDLTPDKSFDYTVPLEKGESGTTPTRKVVGTGSGTKPPDGPTITPNTGSGTQIKPPDTKPPDIKPPDIKPPDTKPPEEDCPPEEMPCLKKFP